MIQPLLFACFIPAILLRGATDGRSFGLIAVAGLIVIWAGVCSVLGHDTLVSDDDDADGGWRESLVPPGPARRYRLRKRRERAGRKPVLDDTFWRGTQGVTGVIVGVGFVAVGVLAALGQIDIR